MTKQATQAFMGKNQLVERLAAQTGSTTMAIALMKARGQMNTDGSLTAAGRERDDMTAEERAKDRASKIQKRPADAFKYNPRTNQATLKDAFNRK